MEDGVEADSDEYHLWNLDPEVISIILSQIVVVGQIWFFICRIAQVCTTRMVGERRVLDTDD